MAFLTAVRYDDAPRNSMQRAAVDFGNAEAAYLMCQCLSAAGCATATTTSGAKTVNTATYLINGVFKSKAANDSPLWTFGVAGVTATTVQASSWQKYVLMLDASGTASAQEGLQSTVSAAAVAWTNIVNYGPWSPLLTLLGAAKSIIGVLTVATSSAGTFIPGTTLLGAAQVTATFIDGIDQSLLPLIGNETGLVVGNF